MGSEDRARKFIHGIGLDADWADHEIAALAAEFEAVRAEERERCARVCEEREGYHLDSMEGADADDFAAHASAATEAGNCAAAIRVMK